MVTAARRKRRWSKPGKQLGSERVEIRSIRFRQSGGFAGLIRSCTMTGDQLTTTDLRSLATYVKDRATAPFKSKARDLLVYEIEVETDCGTVHLDFDEASAPPELSSLIDSLAACARPIPL